MMRPPTDTHYFAEFCDRYGLLLRREAVERGVDDNALTLLVRTGVLVRLRQGLYCLRAVYSAADDAERHRLLCRGIVKLYAEHVVLSHASSCVVQGGPTYGLRLHDAHLTHLTGNGRRQSRVIHHTGDLRVGDVRLEGGLVLTTPARAVFEVACTEGTEAALVQANFFLHRGDITVDDLQSQSDRGERWPGSIHMHVVLFLVEPRIESVGETRCDYLFHRTCLPRPIPQYEVRHPDGRVAARVDFAWPALKVIVEFDGLAKYHRYRREGETIEQMVVREKQREDLIRELTGWTVIRLTWADLDLPEHTAARIRRVMRPAAA